jgi:hypothetical protein
MPTLAWTDISRPAIVKGASRAATRRSADADGVPDPSCDGRQELVARVVAETVVDRLEIVEVEKEHCRGAVTPAVE